ncbi:hypothetical protein EDC01DRAFT_420511 [Geopyxis carbonaria]|nr:hypothetical protein EDC01DRAFT_420511 [Geopyxis carbonaria]
MYHVVPQYPPPAVSYMTRTLPVGDCGFQWSSSTKDVPSSACACKSFWPRPTSPLFCACGHHACYHSEKPQSHAAHNHSHNHKTRAIDAKLQELRDTIAELEAGLLDRDERLDGIETIVAELAPEVDDLRDRGDMLDDGLEAIKARLNIQEGPTDDGELPPLELNQPAAANVPEPATPASSSPRMKRQLEDEEEAEVAAEVSSQPRQKAPSRTSGRTTKKAKK